jgi:hypothetical protein
MGVFQRPVNGVPSRQAAGLEGHAEGNRSALGRGLFREGEELEELAKLLFVYDTRLEELQGGGADEFQGIHSVLVLSGPGAAVSMACEG